LSQRLVTADLVIKAGVVHAFDGDEAPRGAVAVRGRRILAVAADRDGLDGLIGPQTRVVDDRRLAVLPAFFDTHNHQLETGRSLLRVQLDRASNVADVVDAIRQRAAVTAPGEWIVTSGGWHESNLAEQRLPTALELDQASRSHPILVWRGGHVAVASSLALELGGIHRDTPDPPGGSIERNASGAPSGMLVELPAIAPILALLPTPDDDLHALALACARYNERGIGAVRDPGISREELAAYQSLHEAGGLTVRSRVMVLLREDLGTDAKLREIEAWPVRSGFGDDMLRLDGLKLIVDGGVEGAALKDPYATDADYRGHLLISQRDLETVVEAGITRGWTVGCHAVGDAAIEVILDVYERVIARHRDLPPGALTIEHAMLADERQRARAVALGIAIAVQYPLAYALGANMVRYWGAERANRAFPIRAWVEAGALIAAGSDSYIAPYDPLLSIWGMVTRETQRAGRLGVDHAIDRRTAFALYTNLAARWVGESGLRGSLSPGHLADIVAFHTDPLTCDLDALPTLTPAMTIVDGRIVHDQLTS
jgi:predicted amidohydrolase YtcJ